MELIKLQQEKKPYECIDKMNLHFNSLAPIPVIFNLEDYFPRIREKITVNALPKVSPIEHGDGNFYEYSFSLQLDPQVHDWVWNLANNEEISGKLKKHLEESFEYVYDKKPASLVEVLDTFDKKDKYSEFSFFGNLSGCYFDVRYAAEKNCLDTENLYSGIFRNQGLLTNFYRRLFDVINEGDLDYIEINSIVERKSVKMFNKLRKRISQDNSLCRILEREYVKSPFFRLFSTLGFKDIEVITTNEKYLYALKGRKSDNLKFSITNEDDDLEIIVNE